MAQMKKRKRYTDEFRASAVVMLEAAGYPNTKGALTRTAKRLGVAHSVLGSWYRADRNPPPSDLKREKRKDLADMFRDLTYDLLEAAPDAIQDASLRDIIVSAGITVDKLQLLTGGATDRTEVLGGLTHEHQDYRKFTRIQAEERPEGDLAPPGEN